MSTSNNRKEGCILAENRDAMTGKGMSFVVKSWKHYLQTNVLLEEGQGECSALQANMTKE